MNLGSNKMSALLIFLSNRVIQYCFPFYSFKIFAGCVMAPITSSLIKRFSNRVRVTISLELIWLTSTSQVWSHDGLSTESFATIVLSFYLLNSNLTYVSFGKKPSLGNMTPRTTLRCSTPSSRFELVDSSIVFSYVDCY